MNDTPEACPDYHVDPVGNCVYGLKHGNSFEQSNAADILRGLAGAAEPALPVMVETMRCDEDDDVRAACAFALIDIGFALKTRASSAVPALVDTLQNDASEEARSLAAGALAAIGLATPSVLQALRDYSDEVKDAEEWVREAAEEALAQLDEGAQN